MAAKRKQNGNPNWKKGESANPKTTFDKVQPTPEQKSAGWAKKKTLKELLNLCLKGNDEASKEVRKLLSSFLGLSEAELISLSLEEAMDLKQIQKAINKGDTLAWRAIKEQVYGMKYEHEVKNI